MTWEEDEKVWQIFKPNDIIANHDESYRLPAKIELARKYECGIPGARSGGTAERGK